MRIKELARQNIQALTPYQSARRIGGNGSVWVNANESPYSPVYQCDFASLNRYPECQPAELINRYAKYSGVNSDQVIATRGADEGIELLIRTFCEPGQDAILYCPPTYGMYQVSALTCGVEAKSVLTLEEGKLNLPAIFSVLNNVKLIYLCHPNNPSGHLLNPDELKQLLQKTAGQCLVVVDEAYIEFSQEHSMVGWLKEYEHLVILRTLSKAFALAGLRCGFTLANPQVIALLLKTIAPYPLPVPVIDIATQALSAEGIAKMRQQVEELKRLRQQFIQQLQHCDCVKRLIPSFTNFVLIQFKPEYQVFQQLAKQGIVVRDQSAQPGLQNHIRITIGNEQECQQIISALQQLTCPSNS